MSGSREESPDWLRSFQPPTFSLSSGSESPLNNSPLSDDEDKINLSSLFKKGSPDLPDVKKYQGKDESQVKETLKKKSPSKNHKEKSVPARKKKRDEHFEKERGDDEKVTKRKSSEEPTKSHGKDHSVWTLSSDSEPSPNTSPKRKDLVVEKGLSAHDEVKLGNSRDAILEKERVNSPARDNSKVKPLKKEDSVPSEKRKVNSQADGENDGDKTVVEGVISEKPRGPYVSSSRLPLVLSDKVQRSKALLECEGDSIDLSGDVGAVGRIVISDNPSKNPEMLLDLKGTIYKTTIVPSRTFCVVSFGQSEAKIEAIMNDYIQLKPHSNVYEAETMVEGTLDGFTFDLEDEADNVPKSTNQADQVGAAEEQPKGKAKRKAEKQSGTVRKKGKTAGGKPPSKGRKKAQVPKKSKAKK